MRPIHRARTARLRHWLPLLGLAGLGCAPGSGPAADAPADPAQPAVAEESEPRHPFLLAHAEDFPALRARVAAAPWRDLARSALIYARDRSFDPSASDFDAKTVMTELCGAIALAYVLDPRPARALKLRATLEQWQGWYQATGDGVVVRWQQAAMVHSILALDVLHDALVPAERVALEQMLDGMIDGWWANLAQDGTPSTPGVVGLWAIYRGDRRRAEEASELFLARVLDGLTPSGVYGSGSGYAWVREGSDRMAKYALVDVLEHTGLRPGLYAEPRLVGLHEWMYRGAYTPRRTNLTFGDSDPSREIEGLFGYLQPYRANKFSAQAGRNAAWVVRDVAASPLFASYVLLDESALFPTPPTSALWGDSASFWEAGAGVDSLMGALWSSRLRGGHSHRDANSVHLYAYGENVLRNSGYCGFGVGVDAVFDWDWIFEATGSNNTVTLDGAEHDDKQAGGVVEGLTAPGFDYAAATSGPALRNATHVRSLWMVHGQPERPGYFVLLDEVAADAPGVVDVNLHPDSAQETVLAANREYQWTVRHFGTRDVHVNLFLATPPASVEVLDGGLCAFDGNEYVGRYLRSHYPTDAAGRRNVLTLVVPHDATRPKPVLTRLQGGGIVTGAALGFGGGRVDYVLESSGGATLPLGNGFFQARGLLVRTGGGQVSEYFARRARAFGDGAAQPRGFEADARVSLHVRGTEVHIVSAGTRVLFHEPGLLGNVFATEAGTVTSAGPGFLEIVLNPGTWAFDLATGATLP